MLDVRGLRFLLPGKWINYPKAPPSFLKGKIPRHLVFQSPGRANDRIDKNSLRL